MTQVTQAQTSAQVGGWNLSELVTVSTGASWEASDTKKINWSSIGRVSIEEAEIFANYILEQVAQARK